MTEIKERTVDLNVEKIDSNEEVEESELKEESKKEKKESFWDYFARYPSIPLFFGN